MRLYSIFQNDLSIAICKSMSRGEIRRGEMRRKKVVIILREKSLKLRSEGERRLDDDPS